MSLLLRRCCDCNCPIGNRDKFCARCGTRQPRDPAALSLAAGLMCIAIAGAHATEAAANYPPSRCD